MEELEPKLNYESSQLRTWILDVAEFMIDAARLEKKDKIVLDQSQQTGALYSRLDQLNPDAPVTAFIGTWRHSAEMRASTRLPTALAAFGLLPAVAHPPVVAAVPARHSSVMTAPRPEATS